jgi:hypothetical protein
MPELVRDPILHVGEREQIVKEIEEMRKFRNPKLASKKVEL